MGAAVAQAGALSVGLSALGGAGNIVASLAMNPFGGSAGGSYQVPSGSAAATSSGGGANAPIAGVQNRPPGPGVQEPQSFNDVFNAQSADELSTSRLAGNPNAGKTVGRILELGVLGRIKRSLGGGDKVGKAARTLSRLGKEDLVNAVKGGDDVIVDSADVAKEIARRAGGGKAPELHKVTQEQLEQGFLPHYHPDSSHSHVFFEPQGGYGLKPAALDILDLFGKTIWILPPQWLPGAKPVASPR